MGAVSQARRSPSRLPGRKPGSLVPASAKRASLSLSLQRQGRASRSEPNRTKRTKRANRRGYKSVVRSLTAGGHRSASIQGQPLRRLFRDLFLPASPIFLSPPPPPSSSVLSSPPPGWPTSRLPLSPSRDSSFSFPSSFRGFTVPSFVSAPLEKTIPPLATSGTTLLIAFGSSSLGTSQIAGRSDVGLSLVSGMFGPRCRSMLDGPSSFAVCDDATKVYKRFNDRFINDSTVGL